MAFGSREVGILAIVAGSLATAAYAQPRISAVQFSASDISGDGNVIVGLNSNNIPGAIGNNYARWLRSGSPAYATLGNDGLTSGQPKSIVGTGDGSVFYGSMANTSGQNGLPVNGIVAGRWTASTGWTALPLLANASQCGGASSDVNTANGMSTDGRFAVGGSWVDGCRFRAWVYDFNSNTTTNLGNFNGVANESSRADCVSDSGAVIAGYDRNPTTGTNRPAVWEWNGTAYVEQLLPTTGDPATEGGDVLCMTRDGSMMVGRNFGILNHLATWTKVGGVWTAHDLGVIPAHPSWVPTDYTIFDAIPSAVSDDGSVIFGRIHYARGSEHKYGAFIWTQDTGVTDLYDYLVWLNTTGIEFFPSSGSSGFASPSLVGVWGCTADGQHLIGNGWIVDLGGSPCFPPVVSLHPWQNSGLVGNQVIVNSGAIGAAPLTYQWYRNNVPLANGAAPWGDQTTMITGATASQLRLNTAAGVTCSDQGSFTCTIANTCGTVTTDAWELRIASCCYPNCDQSTTSPVLNVADFTCFLQQFAAGASYANCDQSTTAPTLNVADFTCFLQSFAAGCP